MHRIARPRTAVHVPVHVPAPNVPAPDGFEALAADAALASPCPAVTDARGVLNLLRGVGDEDGAWAAIAQVVVETHTTETRAAVLALLGEHYPTVGARDDDEIEGHAIVYARR